MDIIVPVAADLRRARAGEVIVGPETARVLRKAKAVADKYWGSSIYLPAGHSKEHGVIMGSGPMRDYLVKLGFPEDRIYCPLAEEFTTRGEMRAVVSELKRRGYLENLCRIRVVNRWWHFLRAKKLLNARLEGIEADSPPPVLVKGHLVWSNDIIGIIREIGGTMLAWLKIIPPVHT